MNSSYPKTEFLVEMQGGPILNHAYILSKSPDNSIILVEGDMKSKWCKSDGVGFTSIEKDGKTIDDVPSIDISPTDGSFNLTPGKEKEITFIAFPEFVGYNVFSTEVSRYTLRVCFYKKSK